MTRIESAAPATDSLIRGVWFWSAEKFVDHLFELRERLRSGKPLNGLHSVRIFGIQISEKECRSSANAEFCSLVEIRFYFRGELAGIETLLECCNIQT